MRYLIGGIGALLAGFTVAALAQQMSDPGSVDVRQLAHPFAYFSLSGLVGMVGHYVKKWSRNEIDGNFLDYFVRDHGKNSIAAVTGFLGTAVATTLAHGLDGMTATQLVMSGLTTGWAFDSGVNKGTPPAGP